MRSSFCSMVACKVCLLADSLSKSILICAFCFCITASCTQVCTLLKTIIMFKYMTLHKISVQYNSMAHNAHLAVEKIVVVSIKL